MIDLLSIIIYIKNVKMETNKKNKKGTISDADLTLMLEFRMKGKTFRQIADMFGVTPNAVKYRIDKTLSKKKMKSTNKGTPVKAKAQKHSNIVIVSMSTKQEEYMPWQIDAKSKLTSSLTNIFQPIINFFKKS